MFFKNIINPKTGIFLYNILGVFFYKSLFSVVEQFIKACSNWFYRAIIYPDKFMAAERKSIELVIYQDYLTGINRVHYYYHLAVNIIQHRNIIKIGIIIMQVSVLEFA